MSNDQQYLRPSAIGQFDQQAQYPPFTHPDPEPAASRMPGIAVFTQGIAAAIARGKEFDAAAVAGVECFKQITRRCGAEYVHNDVTEAANIARTAAARSDQVKIVDAANSQRLDYPAPSGV